jgi:hypothetical protein
MDANPFEVGQLLITLGALGGIYLKMQGALRAMVGKGEGREITNDPLRTQDTPAPATLRDIERIEARLSRLEDDMGTQQQGSAHWREKLSDELTDLREKVTDTALDQSERLAAIERSLGRLEGAQ